MVSVDYCMELIEAHVKSKNTMRAYKTSTQLYINYLNQTGQSFCVSSVESYCEFLVMQERSLNTINTRLAAIRALARLLRNQNSLNKQSLLEVINFRWRDKSYLAQRRTGIWLTKEQVRKLLELPKNSLIGKRDKAILALLVGCGLRREEVASLKFENLTMRNDDVYLTDFKSKTKQRSVFVPSSVELAIGNYIDGCRKMRKSLREYIDLNITGPLIQGMNKSGKVTKTRIHGQTVWDILLKYRDSIDEPHLQPHDLRRTFAQICYDNGANMHELAALLGHDDISSVETYLCRINVTFPIKSFFDYSRQEK